MPHSSTRHHSKLYTLWYSLLLTAADRTDVTVRCYYSEWRYVLYEWLSGGLRNSVVKLC